MSGIVGEEKEIMVFHPKFNQRKIIRKLKNISLKNAFYFNNNLRKIVMKW